MAAKPLLAVALLASSALATTASGNGDEMRPFERNGYRLSGAEYWPFQGDAPFQYPGDVLWGFYPENATDGAKECALKAYRALEAFMDADWPELREALDLGATRFFYLWTNDYTAASATRQRRPARFGHWNYGSGRDYSSGYWTWEATLTQSGACQVPKEAQIRQRLQQALDELHSVR